jgi:hypothetical protein
MLSVKNLIKVGAIQVGDIIVWNRKKQGVIVELTVELNGKFKSMDGKLFGSPTAAAKNFNGAVEINGWRVWRLKRTGEALDDVRKKYSEMQD